MFSKLSDANFFRGEATDKSHYFFSELKLKAAERQRNKKKKGKIEVLNVERLNNKGKQEEYTNQFSVIYKKMKE